MDLLRPHLPSRPWARGAVRALCLGAVLVAASPACRGGGPAPAEAAGAATHEGNRLAGESSPYLLLHANDPVDWYPWGPEAFERARAEGKPIFLSIGYSACYWCHVMQREVFSDPEIAALMNRWFVNVKVDREERPDVDEVYLTAAQMLSQGGAGWPASLFLTPDLEPFFAASYLPPADQGALAGFPTVARRVHEAWAGERRKELTELASRVTSAVRDALSGRQAPAEAVPMAGAAEAAVAAVRDRYDPEWGGFAAPPAFRPKFPQPSDLLLMLEAWDQGDETAGRMVVESLRAMGRGAIHDVLGGGFHRYTLDRPWRVPHFEKMLYDNALLGEVLAEACRRKEDPELERLGRGTLDFLLDAMELPGGGFLSSFDAESASGGEEVEGAFYTWTAAEVRSAVGDAGFSSLAAPLGLDDEGELPGGRHTLYWTVPPETVRGALGPLLAKLREARAGRPEPRADDKVLTDWNGLAIAALARGAAVWGEPRYLEAARRTAELLLPREGATLLHSRRAGRATVPAFLDDYAFLVHGLLALAEAEGTDEAGAARARRWTAAAASLVAQLQSRLGDDGGGYSFAAAGGHLPLTTRTAIGRATPAGNAVAVLDLLGLSARTGERSYRERAASSLRAFAHELADYPAAVPGLAQAVMRYQATEPAKPEGAAPERSLR